MTVDQALYGMELVGHDSASSSTPDAGSPT